jgi:hypothetical protein
MLASGPRHTPHSYLYTTNRIPPCLLRGPPYSTLVFVYGQYHKDSAMLVWGAAPYSTLIFVYGQYYKASAMLALGPRHTPHSYLYTANITRLPPCLLWGPAILHTHICIRPILQGFRHACLGRRAILHTRICIRPILHCQGFHHAC